MIKEFFRKTTKLWRGLAMVFALLLAVFAVLTNMGNRYEGFINDFFGTVAPKVEGDGEDKYKSAFGELNADNCKELIKAENDFNIRAMREGAVLIRNEGDALPLKADERSVTLFGNSVKDPVYATNGGGSSFKAARGGSMLDAFKNGGFEVNETLYNAYESGKRVSNATMSKQSIGEQPSSFYTDALKNTYAERYNDVAFVMFTRYGGEGVDLSTADADGVPLLSLHKQEADLLKMIKASGKFGKTVVLINSPFPMDLQWIEDEAYGVDACITFGAAGDVGFIGLVDLIKGDADFSGHLSDTYAADSMSAPAMRNFGDFKFSNHGKQYENSYVVYAENIYVGYKYYETRYQDEVLGINGANGSKGVYASENNKWSYAAEMAYTFGHGLSYSDFTQEIKSIVWDTDKHELTAKVKVINNGSSVYDGKAKCAVQLYAQLPYEEGMAEKSAIQLIGFGKTGELARGEDETVTIVVDDYLFTVYDENAINGADASKKGCYVFDKGDYYFAVGADSHDALNNVLCSRGVGGLFDVKGEPVTGNADMVVKTTLAETDNITHARSAATGEVVSNALQDIDYNSYKADAIVYMTRSDWNTYPDSYTGLEATAELKTDLAGNTYVKGSEAVSDFKTDAQNDIHFFEMAEVDYDDDKWESFIDQLSVNDLATICGETMGNKAIVSVNKPANNNTDGPKGLGSTYLYGDKSGITLYVDEVTMASTFNLELHAERGRLFAEDALYSGYSMIFGPGADWHRTAYSGRNSEYYSEDANMSFLCGAAQVRAMQDGGLIAGIKHFAGNDQETNRHGVATFSDEQAFREGSLRCFEGALRDDKGGALGVMTCFNRIGATAGAASYPVQVRILRDEWGFKGVNLTDSSKDASDYVHTKECIVGGTDMFNNDADRTPQLVRMVKQDKDGTILKWLRTANKHYYYAFSRSNLVNGLSRGVSVEDFVPWWKTALKAFDVTFGVLAGVMLALFAASYVFFIIDKKNAGKGADASQQNGEEAKNDDK